MFQILSGFPDDVLAISAKGKISPADYEKVLIPVVDERIRRHKPLKLFFHMGPDFEGMELGAMVKDARLGIGHWRDWGAIAVVTDAGPWRDVIGFFGLMFHQPVRLFFEADYDKAKAWITESQPAEAA
ncbi:MAG TPA: STAS/SEC14 domain-containing protein [Rhizomicrobium sp.]|jgi:hypothetical protein|nr:STAS/SEC14 domain-containing protein [Rhizomicrobium sp.]